MPSLLLRLLDRVFPPNPQAYHTADGQTAHELTKAAGTMGRYLDEVGRRNITVLDFGCGWGGETLWLAERVDQALGADIEVSSIEQARRALAASGRTNCRFELIEDGRLPFPDASVDAVFSTDTFEHVMDLDQAFAEIYRVLRPGGLLITRFGPLFYSPQGYHLYWACQVPWAHLMFGLESILELRNARAGSTMRASSWQEMGLNGRRFSDFQRAAARIPFQAERFRPIAVRGLDVLTRVPGLRDLFIFGIDCCLRRPADGRNSGETAPASDYNETSS